VAAYEHLAVLFVNAETFPLSAFVVVARAPGVPLTFAAFHTCKAIKEPFYVIDDLTPR